MPRAPGAGNPAAVTIPEVLRQASAAYARGDWATAERLCTLVLSARADLFEALNLLGIIKAQTGRSAEAADLLRRAVVLRPDQATALNNLGNILNDLGRFAESLECYDRAVRLQRDYAEAFNNRGRVLRALGRIGEALASYGAAVKLRPGYAEAHYNQGVTLHELQRLDEALASYERAIQARPDYADAYYNRGNALQDLRRFDAAVESFDRALQLRPSFAEAHNNRGNALQSLGRGAEALSSYDRALAVNSGLAEAYNNRGNTLRDLRRFDEALASFESAFRIKPDLDWLRGARLHAKMQLCDWQHIGPEAADLLRRVEIGERVTRPFTVLALTDATSLQRQAAETSAREGDPVSRLLPPIERRGRRRAKIRIGYYSADYHNHATAHLMAGVLELHDRERFEIVAFSFGRDIRDAMRGRLVAAVDRFFDVRAHTDREVAQLSRDLEIDIAIDLKGYSQDARTGIFAHRAAPIQVSYLGYPGTMGASFIDYIVADRTLITTESRPDYSEKVAYLPNSYQANDRNRPIAGREFSRAELGLPATGFVFCCFNSNYKIMPTTFDCWMRILSRVDGSVLWLLGEDDTTARNLRRYAETRGVSSQRLIFAPYMALPEHLARHRAADLFVDTWPCNAHTTASDALWAGLPVLTCAGQSFAARVAASLLNGIGLPELICETQERYEAMAIALATDPDRMAATAARLSENRLTTPLFDSDLFRRHLEDAYTQMHERYHAGLDPADTCVTG